MYYVYVIRSLKDKNLYTGYAVDLRRRLEEHNKKKVISTKSRIPLELIYYEACLEKHDAIKREKYLKSGRGKKYIRDRLRVYFERKS